MAAGAASPPDEGAAPEGPRELAERPTQLDSRSNIVTKPDLQSPLKRATVTRTTGVSEPASQGPGSAASYVGYVIAAYRGWIG